jgi:AraC family transcriptional regulator of adaptative response/methylated-DNA-[protein]-cysteine methyltransferase
MKNGHTTSELIRYGHGSTPVGNVFLALTDKGICALTIAKVGEQSTVEKELRHRFPKAELKRDPKAVAPLLEELREVMSGERQLMKTPLDLRGTPFQNKVWSAMQSVTSGETCSYKELARRAGRPRAVRAVANACARNPVAILVPCHRILRHDGGLGGYGCGLDCKRALLKAEGADA